MIRPPAIVTGILFFSVFLSAATTTTTLSVTPPSPEFGQTVTLTASVSPATALGFVSFLDQGVLVGSATLHSGTAQATTLTLTGGRHSLVAVYGGNTSQSFSASQSAPQSYIVTAVFGSGFAPAHNYGAALFPYSVAVADFNGDGKADLAIANAHSDTVSVLLGNGDGSFQTEVPYTVGNAPQSVVAGDVNGDGIVDLVVVNTGDSNLEVLLGNGNGTFRSGGTFMVQANPLDVVIGDFNLDGKLDLAVANGPNSAGVSILLGNGDGTFQAFAPYAAGTNANSLAVGDFNGDGKPDLAVTDLINNDVNVLLGNGDGTFHAATSSPFMVDSGPTSIAVGDFNGDGKPDLAVANGTSNDVSVLLGNGNGSFQTAVNYAIGSSTQPVSLATGDFNGDGILDIAVANHLANTASVLLGNSNGTFQAAASYGASFFPQAITVGNFTGDGRADLVVANANGDLTTNVSILLAAVPLQFYPLTPCRIADTRTSQRLHGRVRTARAGGVCGPQFPDSFLGVLHSIDRPGVFVELHRGSGRAAGFPLGVAGRRAPIPGVSTLNSTDGSVIANAAIVPAGTGGSITVVAGNPTDLIIDINGYFARARQLRARVFPAHALPHRGHAQHPELHGSLRAAESGRVCHARFPARDQSVPVWLGAGLFLERDGGSPSAAGLPVDMARGTTISERIDAELARRHNAGERGDCSRGDQRRHRRGGGQPDRRDYRHQREVRRAGSGRTAILRRDTVPRGRYAKQPELYRRVRAAEPGGICGPQFSDSIQPVRHPMRPRRHTH